MRTVPSPEAVTTRPSSWLNAALRTGTAVAPRYLPGPHYWVLLLALRRPDGSNCTWCGQVQLKLVRIGDGHWMPDPDPTVCGRCRASGLGDAYMAVCGRCWPRAATLGGPYTKTLPDGNSV